MTEASVRLLAARSAVRRCTVPGPMLVGCSGGPDSLALVAAASWVARHQGTALTVGVVDHRLQPDSAQIAARAAEACHALGVDDVVILPVDVGSDGGVEAAARDVRRSALLDLAERRDSTQILLAHTRDDQAETVLLRLTRGAGARSLAAMRACAPPWHRPFLDLSREDVHEVAAEVCGPLGISPWIDPHNSDMRFGRVRVRRMLTEFTNQMGPGVVPGLARSAALLADDADLLDAWAGEEEARIASVEGAFGRVTVSADVAALSELPRAIRTRVIRLMHERVSSGDELTFDHVMTLEAYVSQWHGQGDADLPGAVTAHVDCGRLYFLPAPSPEASSPKE